MRNKVNLVFSNVTMLCQDILLDQHIQKFLETLVWMRVLWN